MGKNNFLHSFKSAVVFVGIFFLTACYEQQAKIGDLAPELAVYDLQGNAVTLAQGIGKPQLISFWSETCGVCIAEMKVLQEWATRYPNRVRLLAINIDGEKADIQTLVNKQKITLPVVKDQLKITAERYQLMGTPTSFLIDVKGKLTAKIESLLTEEKLQQIFNPDNH